jgi:hypothetical protein
MRRHCGGQALCCCSRPSLSSLFSSPLFHPENVDDEKSITISGKLFASQPPPLAKQASKPNLDDDDDDSLSQRPAGPRRPTRFPGKIQLTHSLSLACPTVPWCRPSATLLPPHCLSSSSSFGFVESNRSGITPYHTKHSHSLPGGAKEFEKCSRIDK